MTSPSDVAPSPLRIGVAMIPAFERRGVSLAEARAYEAAGCDSLWLEGDEDPWLSAAALATVTARVRLVVPVGEDDVATPDALVRRAATLHRLAPGRVALWCADGGLPAQMRTALSMPMFCAVAALTEALAGACGVVVAEGTECALPGGAAIWSRCAPPADRVAWRRLLESCRHSGAAGIVVPETPRLLDLLRNPDRDDNRSDLALAHG
jgi:hypothetical protein